MDRIARIAPSARLEQQIAELLSQGVVDDRERLAELGRLGARLVLQRAVDEEVAAFLGRARYQRTSAATGSRNGTRPKPIQTAEGEISIAMPQVRNTAEHLREPGDPGHQSGSPHTAIGGTDHRQLRTRVIGSGYRESRRRG